MNGGYQIVDLTGVDVETGTVSDVVKTNKPLLIHGVTIQDVTLPDFWFDGTTEDGELFTKSNIYLSYYISVNRSTGAIQCATAG